MLDKNLEWLKRENMDTLDEAEYDKVSDDARKKFEAMLQGYEREYGSYKFPDGNDWLSLQTFVYICKPFDFNEGEDEEEDHRLTVRAFLKGDCPDPECYGEDDIWGWFTIYDIILDENGVPEHVEEFLLHNIYTEDELY